MSGATASGGMDGAAGRLPGLLMAKMRKHAQDAHDAARSASESAEIDALSAERAFDRRATGQHRQTRVSARRTVVEDLALRLGVTESTVRRDLQRLASEGRTCAPSALPWRHEWGCRSQVSPSESATSGSRRMRSGLERCPSARARPSCSTRNDDRASPRTSASGRHTVVTNGLTALSELSHADRVEVLGPRRRLRQLSQVCSVHSRTRRSARYVRSHLPVRTDCAPTSVSASGDRADSHQELMASRADHVTSSPTFQARRAPVHRGAAQVVNPRHRRLAPPDEPSSRSEQPGHRAGVGPAQPSRRAWPPLDARDGLSRAVWPLTRRAPHRRDAMVLDRGAVMGERATCSNALLPTSPATGTRARDSAVARVVR